MTLAGFTEGRQEGGERCAVVLGHPCLECIGQCGRIIEAVQYVEHAEAFAGIGRHGEHPHFHAGFQLLVGFGHVLRQRLLAGREKQQTPLLHLSACLSSIIGASLPGAVAEHVHRFANDARVAHADFIQHQEPVGMRGGDGFQRVIGGAPRTHQTRPAVDRGGHLQVGGLAARAVTVQVKAARLMAEHVQQRTGKRHAGHKRQAVIADAQCADLLLPLLQRAGFADRRKLRAGLVEVQVFAVRADLLLGQQKGAVVPAQAGDQSCALRAVEAAEVTLQVVACIASGATTGETQTHVHQRAEHVLAEVAGHGPRRDVPALFGPVGIVELDQQTPVVTLVHLGCAPGSPEANTPGAPRRRHRNKTRLRMSGESRRASDRFSVLRRAWSSGFGLGFGLVRLLGAFSGSTPNNSPLRSSSAKCAAVQPLAERIGRVVAVVPLTTFGEGRLVVLERGLAFEDVQGDDAHRRGADLVQLFGDGVHAAFAAGVVVWPQHHGPTFERCQVGFVPGVRAVRPARGHVVGQQFRRGVGGLFAFAQNDRCVCALRQFIQAQQWTRLRQTLPTPLLRLTVGTLAPGQGCKHLASACRLHPGPSRSDRAP